MLLTKSEGIQPCGFQVEVFLKVFYHIWTWVPFLSCDHDHLNKLLFRHPKESLYEIGVQWPSGFRRGEFLKCLRTEDTLTPVSLVYY